MSKASFFLEIEPTSGEDALKIVEMPRKDLECYINLLGKKASEGLERIDSNFVCSSTVSKMLSNSMACCREIVQGRVGR